MPTSLLQQYSASRILVFGGILLLVINMLLGEVFAIFISHVANGEIRTLWGDVIIAARAGQLEILQEHFERIEFLLDRRGRIMNTHSHAGAFGILALMLALIQPMLAMAEITKRRLAFCVIAGGIIQPFFIFASSYTGLWANYLSHLGALLIIIGISGTIIGLLRSNIDAKTISDSVHELLKPASSRLLLRWGSLLILLGMLFGFGYAWVFTTEHEPRQYELIESMLAYATDDNQTEPRALVKSYRGVNSSIAILSAVHSHAIEMGTIAILLAFIQSFIFMSDRTRLIWARAFLSGGFLLPFFIFNATIFGLRSAALADISGFIVLVSLIAMLSGSVRYSGIMDAQGDEPG